MTGPTPAGRPVTGKSSRTADQGIVDWTLLCRLTSLLIDGNAHFLAMSAAAAGKPYDHLWPSAAEGPDAVSLSEALSVISRLAARDQVTDLYIADLASLPRYRIPAFIEATALLLVAGFLTDEIRKHLAVPESMPDRAALLSLAALRGVRITGLPTPEQTTRERP